MTTPPAPSAGLAPVPARTMVLGATGFIGRWMARTLSGVDADLVLASRSALNVGDERWGIRGKVHIVDLCDRDAVKALVARERPDVVFNLAGYGVDRAERDEQPAHQLNAILPGVLAEACAALPPTDWTGARLVHVGSALEYGVTGGVLAETSAAQPTTLYGATKLAGTLAVADVARRTGLRCLTARLFTVFGPGEHRGRLFPTLVRAAAGSGDIPLSEGHQARDFAFAGDVAGALLQLATAPSTPGEVVNLASGVMYPVREFARAVASVLGIAAERLRFGAVPVRPEEMAHDGVSVSRLMQLIGRSLDSDLQAIIRRAVDAGDAIGWRPGG